MNDRPPAERQANHLAGQTSPYLLQHLYNPVDWYPWGPIALERARTLDRPIFLSVGYAACHWCHVMERESFEDDEIAALLNEHFVPIKVDREERPDIDEIYMTAVQLMTGSGGWPMSVFLTPELKPFIGGTYFPPRDMYGRPGFQSVLARVRQAWTSRRNDIESAGTELTENLQRIGAGQPGDPHGPLPGSPERARAVAELIGRFDGQWGGFGAAPKFPPHGGLALLLHEHRRGGEAIPRDVVELTLDRMAEGGMYDQIGGGFSRYSVDEQWLVPHFEKMLYDQALLVPVYVDAWLALGKPLYRRVVEQTLDFVRRELTAPTGGFYSSLDADSEGVEGKFYVWDPQQIRAVLGDEDGEFFCRVYGIEAGGNFEGKSIPNLLGGSLAAQAATAGADEAGWEDRLAPLRARLLEARELRVRPATDDKVLTAWNGLMIGAFARAHQAFGHEIDLLTARDAAEFVLEQLYRDGRLLVSYREGQAQLGAYLDDHAFLARGLIDLYESCFDRRYLKLAAELAATIVDRFQDEECGGFYFTADDHEALLTRTKSTHDGAMPAGTGVACETLLRLALHLDDARLRDPALRALSAMREGVGRSPSAYTSLVRAAEYAADDVVELAIVGQRDAADTRALLEVVRGRYLPSRVIALGAPGTQEGPLLAGKNATGDRATAFVCRGYRCEAPVTDPAALAAALDVAAAGS